MTSPTASVALRAGELTTLLGAWRTHAPLTTALADRLRLLVLDGRLLAGTRLPAERELAARLGLSRTTVAAAYGALREAGFADTVRGSGTVAALPRARVPGPHPGAAGEPAQPGLLDLTKATMPATALLPDALRAASEDALGYLGGPGYEILGLDALREAVAQRYTDRGIPTGPHEVLITTGAQQAITLVARVLLAPGDRALVELPTYPHAMEALRLAGARLVPAPVVALPADGRASGDPGDGHASGDSGDGPVSGDSGDGWDVAALEQTVRHAGPALAYLVPDFHNPTGSSMSVETRERVLRAARAQGMVVLADETTGELDVDRGPRPSLGALARHGQGYAPVVLVGSASKTFWGGLRVGWVRAEASVIRRLAAARPATDLGTPVLEQLLMARLVPRTDEVLAERREQLAAGRDALRRLVARHLPSWRLPRIEGGLATWVTLPAPASSSLVLAARSHGVELVAGPRFGLDGTLERFLRLPLTASAAELERAVRALALAWAQAGQVPQPYPGVRADADVV